MSYPYSVHKTYVTGEVLTAADLNSSDVTHVNHNIPEDTDDYSVNAAEMQSTVDPYPASSESLPTSLAGELERLRYQIKAITGETHWYHDIDVTLALIALKIGTSGTQVLTGTGEVGAPSYSFADDPNTGIYNGPDNIYFAANGASICYMNESGLAMQSGKVIVSDGGTVSLPGFSFIGDVDLGIYRIGADNLGISVGATKRIDVGTSTVSILSSASGTSEILSLDDVGDTTVWVFEYTDATGQLHLKPTSIAYPLKFTSNQVLFGAGTGTSPGISFANDSNTGFANISADNIGLIAAGIEAGYINSNGIFMDSGKLIGADQGSVSLPGYGFVGDTNTGMYSSGGDNINFTCGGADIAYMNTSVFGMQAGKVLQIIAGTASLTGLSFMGDANTGLYSPAADSFILACGGVDAVKVDGNNTAGQTRLIVYDVDNAALSRVSVGTADSGGTGYKLLRIEN